MSRSQEIQYSTILGSDSKRAHTLSETLTTYIWTKTKVYEGSKKYIGTVKITIDIQIIEFWNCSDSVDGPSRP